MYAYCSVTLERDEGADGFIDETETLTYGGASNLERVVRDGDADGAPDYMRSLHYSSEGLLEPVLVDHGYDGDIDQTISFSNMAGRLFRRSVALNGVVLYATYYVYDSHGNMVRRLRDADNDDRGRRTQAEEDWWNDGVVDYSTSYTWRDDLIIRTDGDSGDDGTVEQSFVYSYDDAGHLVRLEVVDERGTERLAGTYEYDELYRVVIKRSHDGTETWSDRTLFGYDAAGRVVEQRWESRAFFPPYVVYQHNDCPQPLQARIPSVWHERGNGSDWLHFARLYLTSQSPTADGGPGS